VSQHDEEQVENLKRFFKDYGAPILTGVVLALAVFGAWKYWDNQRTEASTKAASVFQDMLGAVQRSQVNPADKAASTDVQRYAKTLREDYSKTPFAVSAGLLLARQAVDRNDFKEAEKQLKWALGQKPEESVRILATTRLARVLAADKRFDEAQALLIKETDPGFKPTVEELKGDIYQAQGKIAEAQKAYLAAVQALHSRDDERRPLLEMKMADVGLAVPEQKKTDDKSAAAESKSS
jgi:predicted negative regulator of RcsB-dependent stress response